MGVVFKFCKCSLVCPEPEFVVWVEDMRSKCFLKSIPSILLFGGGNNTVLNICSLKVVEQETEYLEGRNGCLRLLLTISISTYDGDRRMREVREGNICRRIVLHWLRTF
jgi:hypothetical protein